MLYPKINKLQGRKFYGVASGSFAVLPCYIRHDEGGKDHLWKMQLNQVLFCNTDPLLVDYQKHARCVMSRVVMYGNLEEWKQVIQFYGRERIAEELTQERELDIKASHFLSTVLNLPITRFRCYSAKP